MHICRTKKHETNPLFQKNGGFVSIMTDYLKNAGENSVKNSLVNNEKNYLR